MALNVISNFAANVAVRNLQRSDQEMTESLSKLSAGQRVLSAKDDAASLAIGSRLMSEVKALGQAAVNSGQAVSMLQVADGAMARANDILLRMKTLAVQAGSGQLSADERTMLDTEYQQLLSEVDRLALDTEFNGTQLVNGAIVVDRTAATDFEVTDGLSNIIFRGAFTDTSATIAYDTTADSFSVTTSEGVFTGTVSANAMSSGTSMLMGTSVTLSNPSLTNKIDLVLTTGWTPNAAHATGTLGLSTANTSTFTYKVGTGTSATADEIAVSINGISASNLGINNTNVTNVADSDTANSTISIAIDTLNTARATIGAAQNRLEFSAANIATTLENMEAARSRLLDLDIASEMSRFTSKQVLVQAGVAMLAQANQTPQNLLRLFQ
jgi:flagellin